jgi:large subunit ribosomal protein L31e
MAKDKKKDKDKKIVLERVYNIPLRREFIMVPQYKRAKRAISGIKKFLIKHMKSDKVKLGKYLNLKIWEHGIKNPPHHVKVNVKKDEEGNVFAEIVGAPVDVVPVKAEKKETKKETESIKEEIKQMEEKTEKIIEEKAEKAKDIQKEEIKEMKKEKPKKHAPKSAVAQQNVEAHQMAPSGNSEMRKP